MEGEGCVQEEREADQEEGAVVCEITTKLKGEATTDDKLGMDLGRNIFIQSNFQKQKKYYQLPFQDDFLKVPILSYKEHTELFGFSFQVCNTTTDRKHADTFLEKCVTESIMNIVSGFFNSPFSDNSTSLQVTLPKSKKHPVTQNFCTLLEWKKI